MRRQESGTSSNLAVIPQPLPNPSGAIPGQFALCWQTIPGIESGGLARNTLSWMVTPVGGPVVGDRNKRDLRWIGLMGRAFGNHRAPRLEAAMDR